VTAPTKTLTRTGPPRKKVKALALMETLVLAETILSEETLVSAETLWGRRGEGFQKGSGMGILSLTIACAFSAAALACATGSSGSTAGFLGPNPSSYGFNINPNFLRFETWNREC